MWNLCRPAALAQLQRVVFRAPALRASSMVLQTLGARPFTANATVAGVELRHLLESSPAQLAAELGKDKLGKVQRALAQEFTDTVAAPNDVTSDEIAQLFLAAQKTRLSSLMLRTFAYMKQHFPDDIDFVMYGEVFRVLSRERNGAKLYEIYEFARPRFEPAVPELIYRFGIVGKIELGEMDQAYALVEAMQNDGHFVTNEIYSRLMGGFARANNTDKLIEIYERLDPTSGHWHESAIDRCILSLGVGGQPDLAFEFYVNSNMKLNGGTLITLLSVCRHNNCRQQAADILENRKRFDLQLDARAYNGILQTLEFLDRHDDIASVLDEMNDAGIRFDTRTKEIVARNQSVLKGSYFDLSLARERSQIANERNPNVVVPVGTNKKDKVTTSENAQQHQHQQHNHQHNRKMTAFIAMPELKALVAEKNFAEAAALADQFVRDLKVGDLPQDKRQDADIADGALRVPTSIAKEAVQAYIGNHDLEKIDGLLKGFVHTEARIGFALMEIMLAYSEEEKPRGKHAQTGRPSSHKKLTKAQNELAYRAAKIMGQQGWQIYRVAQALQLFRQFGDADAARRICEQLLLEYAGQDNAGDAKRKITAASASQTLVYTLRTFAETNDVAGAFALLDKAEETGFRIEPAHYVGLLTGMRENSIHTVKQKGVVVLATNYRDKPFYYTSDDFAAVLDNMAQRGVRMTRAIVSNVCFALAAGDKIQRTRLLEAYAAATTPPPTDGRHAKRDTFTIPTVVYSVLLQLSGRENSDMVELQQIYEDAVASLAEVADPKTIKRVPLDWEIVVISHLADAGLVDEAAARLQNMYAACGSYSYEPVVKVLRGSIAAKNDAAIKTALTLVDEREFKFTLGDAYDLVHLAKDADLPNVAFDVVTLYERAHGRSTDAVVDHTKSHQSVRDKFAVRKIRSMYRAVLKLCEQNGQWKRALAFSQRVNELLAFETSETDRMEDNDEKSDIVQPSDGKRAV